MHHHQLTCIIIRRDTAGMMLLVATFLAASTVHTSPPTPSPNSYTLALHKALMFFNAQRSGKLSDHSHVSWRGDSCLTDGKPSATGSPTSDLVGGYYDAGNAIKFNFPASFAMTMLSWSVIEYNAKYEAAEELTHIKDVIKWGTDYFSRPSTIQLIPLTGSFPRYTYIALNFLPFFKTNLLCILTGWFGEHGWRKRHNS